MGVAAYIKVSIHKECKSGLYVVNYDCLVQYTTNKRSNFCRISDIVKLANTAVEKKRGVCVVSTGRQAYQVVVSHDKPSALSYHIHIMLCHRGTLHYYRPFLQLTDPL